MRSLAADARAQPSLIRQRRPFGSGERETAYWRQALQSLFWCLRGVDYRSPREQTVGWQRSAVRGVVAAARGLRKQGRVVGGLVGMGAGLAGTLLFYCPPGAALLERSAQARRRPRRP